MQRAVYDQLMAARAAKTPAVLVTFLRSGEQSLIFPNGAKGADDPALFVAARASMIADKPPAAHGGGGRGACHPGARPHGGHGGL